MAEVQKGAPTREVVADRPNQVLSTSEVKIHAFRFTDAQGNVDVTLALCFGKDQEDGGPGVYVLPPQVMRELKIPARHIKQGLREKFAAQAKRAELEDGGALPEFGGLDGNG